MDTRPTDAPATAAPSPTPAPRPPLILATDDEGRVQHASPALRQLLGRSARALAGQPHAALIHPLQPPRAEADLWATLRAGHPWAGLLAYRLAEGEACWMQVHAAPLRREGRWAGHLLLHSRPVEADAALDPRLHRCALRASAPGLQPALQTQAWSLPLMWRLRLAAAGLAALGMAGGWLGGLAGAALGGHLAVCAVGGLLLSGWLRRQVWAPWRLAQQQALALVAGHALGAVHPAVPAGSCPGAEQGLLHRALQQAGWQLQALRDELGPQVHRLCAATRGLAHDSDDLGQRTELAAAALQQTAATLDQLGLDHVREAMARLDDATQDNAARTDRCRAAAAALARQAQQLSESFALFVDHRQG